MGDLPCSANTQSQRKDGRKYSMRTATIKKSSTAWAMRWFHLIRRPIQRRLNQFTCACIDNILWLIPVSFRGSSRHGNSETIRYCGMLDRTHVICLIFNLHINLVMRLCTFRPLLVVPTPFDCCARNHHADFHRHNPTDKFSRYTFRRREFFFAHNHRKSGPALSIDMDSHYLCDSLRSPCRAHHETIQWQKRFQDCANTYHHYDWNQQTWL